MCSFGTFNGCHGNGSQELIKNREKMLIFVICVIFKCDLSPIYTSKVISLFIRNSLALFLINSCLVDIYGERTIYILISANVSVFVCSISMVFPINSDNIVMPIFSLVTVIS